MTTIQNSMRGTALAALVLLSACGGGGGGGDAGPRASGDLTAANYVQTANALVPLVAGGESAAGELELAVKETMAKATDSGIVSCSGGGSLLFTQVVARPNEATPGDKVTVTAQSCVEDGELLTGSLEAELLAFSQSYGRIGLTAMAFGTPELRLNGKSVIELDERTSGRQTVRVHFNGMTVSMPKENVSLQHGYEYVREGGLSKVSVSGFAYTGGQSYELRQRSAFVLSATTGMPQSGVLDLVDKDGDRVEVKVSGERYTYTYYPAGSSTPGAGPVDGPLVSEL